MIPNTSLLIEAVLSRKESINLLIGVNVRHNAPLALFLEAATPPPGTPPNPFNVP